MISPKLERVEVEEVVLPCPSQNTVLQMNLHQRISADRPFVFMGGVNFSARRQRLADVWTLNFPSNPAMRQLPDLRARDAFRIYHSGDLFHGRGIS